MINIPRKDAIRIATMERDSLRLRAGEGGPRAHLWERAANSANKIIKELRRGNDAAAVRHMYAVGRNWEQAMSYIPVGFTDEQEAALLDITPEDIRALDVDRRIELVIQHKEQQVAKRDAFWNAVQAFATAALPIAAFLGISQLFGKRT